VIIPGLVCALGLIAIAASPPDTSGGEASAGPEFSEPQESPEPQPISTVSKWDLRKQQRWLIRWAPEPHMFELGIDGGAFRIAGHPPSDEVPALRKVNPTVGLRAGYYPIRLFGIEAEAGVIRNQAFTEFEPYDVAPFTLRGHAVAQLGLWSVTPFVLVGVGMLTLNANGTSLGSDNDLALHFGGGVKVFLNRWLMLRLDARDVVADQLGVDNDTLTSHNLELLLGFSVTLNRKNQQLESEPAPLPVPLPGDRDADGRSDDIDNCPGEPETVNGYRDEDGCAELDRNGDGYFDA
jgi:OmpA-OmpF porin, OOP family